ncbi:hypothetical protein LIER_25570 [Lithospermum erythrorhizon]|uniref:DUF4371 domain-containing protein n=1 Tax=Lithospermum erythrorhizon TaxID=34254 RepID=A0AAV3R8A6_LITER
MAVVLRFVDSKGFVVERLISIVHIEETSAITALENLLLGFGLCIAQIRGQRYDEANNMKDVNSFFAKVTRIVNLIRSSNKGSALLRKQQVAHFEDLVENDMVETGTGLNQQLSLARAGDTRWGSHFGFLLRLKKMFTPIVEVLEELKYDRTTSEAKDDILKELNERFSPESTKLLQYVACLSPGSSFEAFDTKSIVKMERLYPNDFDDVEDEELSTQLEVYIHCVRTDANFSNLKGLFELCKTLVRTKKHKTFRFVKLALTLAVSFASVERAFSRTNYVMDDLRTKMSNAWLNDSMRERRMPIKLK